MNSLLRPKTKRPDWSSLRGMKTNTPSIPVFVMKWSSKTISKASVRICRRLVRVHWDLPIRRGKFCKQKWLAMLKIMPQKPKSFLNNIAQWPRTRSKREQWRSDPFLMKSFNSLEQAQSNLFNRHLQISRWLTNTILSQAHSNSRLILTTSETLSSVENFLF